ncbi:MAG: hypothetical protein F6K16_28825 [Symploca sp. SIO2B6]|nr:hypothetical protein [Symploca sp. SIO2B6]
MKTPKVKKEGYSILYLGCKQTFSGKNSKARAKRQDRKERQSFLLL